VAIFLRKDIKILDWEAFNTPNIEGIAVTIDGQTEEIKIINIYCPRGVLLNRDTDAIMSK
jgi:hypothetical protein